MDPALEVIPDQAPVGEPEPVSVPADAEGSDDDDGPPALEEGFPERPSDSVDEGEVTAAQGLISPVAHLNLNKKHDAFKLNLAHQETDRILNELEANCEAVIQAGGADAWIPMGGLQNLICQELGYEDEGELEDAMGGTFVDFVQSLPHIEMITNETPENAGRLELRMRPPEGDGNGFIKTLRVTRSEDLWRTLYKAPEATFTIPQLEFMVGASEKRQLDAVYNHLGNAMFNLSTHISNGQAGGEQKEGILNVIEALEKCLDITEPWDLVITDPSGKSIFKPEDGVVTTPLDAANR